MLKGFGFMKVQQWIWLIWVLVIMTGCRPDSLASQTDTLVPVSSPTSGSTALRPTMTPMPPATASPTATERTSPTHTASPVEIIPTVSSENATQTAVPSYPQTGAIIVDHTSLALFDSIPRQFIEGAGKLNILYRHASVGQNIRDGLNCLMNDFDRRPAFCDRGLASDEIFYDPIYDSAGWTFEFHSPPPSANPGWWNKVNFFIDRIDNLTDSETFDYVGFNVCYVDGLEGSNIDDIFFSDVSTDQYPNIINLEELESRHPDLQFIYFTMCLARIIGSPDSQSFNDQMREYALDEGKILFDMADIQTHNPQGELCVNENGIPVLCPEYTDEVNAGHLNARGRLRMAKAMWVLMARLAGWDGGETLAP
jgi:hypothetical protein